MNKIKSILALLTVFTMLFSVLPNSYAESGEQKIGKTVEGIYIPYSTVLPCYTDEDIKASADNLFSIMNPESEDTKDMYLLYTKGYYVEAMTLFRNYMIDRIRRTPIHDILKNIGGYKVDYLNESVNVMCGIVTNNKYGLGEKSDWKTLDNYKDGFGFSNFIDPDLKMEGIKWDIEYRSDVENWYTWPKFNGFGGACGYWYTIENNPIYLKKFFQVMESWATERKKVFMKGTEGMTEGQLYEWATASGNEQYSYVPLPARYAWASIRYIQSSADIIGGLSMIIKAMPCEENDGIYGFDNYHYKGAEFTKPMDEETYNLIDPVRFARICHGLIDGDFKRLYSYIMSPNHVPNQQIEGTQAYFQFQCLFKDFLPCQEYIQESVSILKSKVFGSIYEDGGMLEKSFNYNDGTVAELITDFAQMAPEFLAMFGNAGKTGTYWSRLKEGYSSNTGLLPNIGNLSNSGSENVWSNAAAFENMSNRLGRNMGLEYNSVAYPYSGYVAMRNGWGINDLYMSFFNNDYRSNGHKIVGTNGIMSLSAYGRTMLVSGGSPWYGKNYANNEIFNEKMYAELNSYMNETSTRKISTVMVNGKSQEAYDCEYKKDGTFLRSNALVQEVKTEPLSYRWGTSDSFDFTEGSWSGGYTSLDIDPTLTDKRRANDKKYIEETQETASTRDADHKREIIFVKDADLWIVTDKMSNFNGQKNKYTQIWNFAAYEDDISILSGYTEDQVVLDEENHTVKTADPNGPNLNIINFSDKELSYTKYYGYFKDGESGIGWSRGSNDENMGGFAERADVWVEWKDDGYKNEESSVISVLAPSVDDSSPIAEKKSLFNDDISGCEITTKSGVNVKYYTSPNVHDYKEGNIEAKAKTFLITDDGKQKKGLVLDCDYIQINDTPSIYNTYRNFSFVLDENGNFKSTSEIAVPKSFEWVENADKTYVPAYSTEEAKTIKRLYEGRIAEFKDIEGHWAEKIIKLLQKKGIIGAGQLYYPDRNIQRKDFIKMVVMAMGYEIEKYDASITDVLQNNEYAPYIWTGYVNGLVSGDDTGKFNPDSYLTREEMVKILVNAKNKVVEVKENSFADKNEISEWANEYVNIAYSIGVIAGDDNNKFNPQSKLTRAEAASSVYNLITK